MKPGTFDTLTKALASTTSRRRAFRRIGSLLAGGTLGGVVLAEFSPGVALADGGNSDCADFCNAVFAPGSDRGQCKSDAAHGTGLCYTCGPKSSGGSQAICCPSDSNGQCTSYSSATCCGSSGTCLNGSCCPTSQACSNGTCCPSGKVCLSNGTCATPCTNGGGFCQGASGRCGVCTQDKDGHLYCQGVPTHFGPFCTSDSDCPTGKLCRVDGICVTATGC
jgi:hypothetical protein